MNCDRTPCAIDRWIEDRFLFIDHDFDDPDDDVTLEWIIERAADAVLRYGIRCLVIDPWNEIEHARRREGKRCRSTSGALCGF